MKKNVILSFVAGVVITLVICISFTVFNNLKKENRSDVVQVVDAFSELDRALYVSAGNRFEHKDYKGALKDMQTSDKMFKVIHRDNPHYKRESEAVKCLTRMVDLNDKIKKKPDDYKLYYERAMVQDKPKISLFVEDYSFCSDYKSAVSDYSKAIQLNPNLKEAYERRADATGMSMDGLRYDNSERAEYEKMFKQNFKNMISDYEKAIELKAASKYVPLKLSGVYFYDEQYDKSFNIAEKMSKTDREGYYLMALNYYKLKQYKDVIDSLDKYIEAPETIKNPDLPQISYREKAIYTLRAKANFKLHRYKDWFKDMKKAETQD